MTIYVMLIFKNVLRCYVTLLCYDAVRSAMRSAMRGAMRGAMRSAMRSVML